MSPANVKFSTLTTDQVKEVQSLESKINSTDSSGQKTVLIAYATSE